MARLSKIIQPLPAVLHRLL